jgi:hypothetical protein
MHLVGYLYEDYHDVRSLQHKVRHILSSWAATLCGLFGHEDESLATLQKIWKYSPMTQHQISDYKNHQYDCYDDFESRLRYLPFKTLKMTCDPP